MTAFPSAGFFGNEAILDSNGDLVISTPVTVYISGTLTPAALYTDETKATPATNPVSTDALGGLQFFTSTIGLVDLAFTVGGVSTVRTVVVDPWPGDLGPFTEIPLFGITAPGGTALAGVSTGSPTGLLQVGLLEGTTSSIGTLELIFPTPFPNALLAVIPTMADDNNAGQARIDKSFTPALNAVMFAVFDPAGALVVSSAVDGVYIAIGQ